MFSQFLIDLEGFFYSGMIGNIAFTVSVLWIFYRHETRKITHSNGVAPVGRGERPGRIANILYERRPK
jgi:hypothetical protein